MTKAKVLSVAKAVGYRPNLAARYLSSKRGLRIAVNTPKEIAHFYDLVRRGVNEEANPFKLAGVELQHMIFPRLGEGEVEAFQTALRAKVDGMIVVPGDLARLRPYFRQASRAEIPVVCLVTDAPAAEKLSSVSINTESSGALVAELLGRFLMGKGRVAVTSGDLRVSDHSQKFAAFSETLRTMFPKIKIFPPLENHDSETEAYEITLAFLKAHRDLDALYISTGNGAPALRAIQDAGFENKITVVGTNIYDELAKAIERGGVAATLYEQPYSQGRIAFRMMHEYLVEGRCPPARVAMPPLLIMRSNLKFFVHGQGRTRGRLGASPTAFADETLFFESEA